MILHQPPSCHTCSCGHPDVLSCTGGLCAICFGVFVDFRVWLLSDDFDHDREVWALV